MVGASCDVTLPPRFVCDVYVVVVVPVIKRHLAHLLTGAETLVVRSVLATTTSTATSGASTVERRHYHYTGTKERMLLLLLLLQIVLLMRKRDRVCVPLPLQ